MSHDPGGINPYENIAEQDEYRPPPPQDYVSTGSVGCVVVGCLALFIGLGVGVSAITLGPQTSPGFVLALLAGAIAIPIAVGWAAISWLRNR